MVALAANAPRPARNLGPKRSYPVLTNVRIYAGALVMITSAGYAAPAAASASNLGCVGVAVAEANNTGGASGAISVEVQEGEFLFAGDTLTVASNSAIIFADDDNTVDETQAANLPRAGFCSEFVSATEAWVAVGLAYSK